MTLRLSHLSMLAAAVLFAVTSLVSCGSKPKQGPTTTLDQYSAALRGKKYNTAYSMMSERFRAKHSKQEFVRMMKDNSREVRETATRLQAAHHDFDVTAELRYGLGNTMRLVREGGSWRIATNPVLFYSRATPRDTLRSFVRAYKLKRWNKMMEFVPTRYREKMTVDKMREQFDGVHKEEIATMMNMLEANIDEPIDDKGNEARMPYGDRYEVRFVREEGLWKIQDLD